MSLSGAGMQPRRPRSLAQPRLGTSCPPPGPALPLLGLWAARGARLGDSMGDGDGVCPSVHLQRAAAGAAVHRELCVWLRAQPRCAELLAAALGWIRPSVVGFAVRIEARSSGQEAVALQGPHACTVAGWGGGPCAHVALCRCRLLCLQHVTPPGQGEEGVRDRRKREGKQLQCREKSLIVNQQQRQPRAPG